MSRERGFVFLQNSVQSHRRRDKKITMAAFRIILVGLFTVVFFYLAHQLTRFASLPLGVTLFVNFFLIFVIGLILALPLYFWSERRLEHKPWHDSFFSASHFAMGYISFLITFVILRDVFSFVMEYTSPTFNTESLYNKEALGFMLLAPIIFILLGTLVVRIGPQVKRVELSFKNLPAELENLKLLHITDLHISPGLPKHFVETLAKKANELNPDIVAYTGDILDSLAIRHLKEFESLKKIKSRLGSYYVPGNHEYYWDFDQGMAAFRTLNFNILINQTADIKIDNKMVLQISGIPDPAARMVRKEEPDFEKVAQNLKPDAFKILLAHQPSLADQACEKEFDLQLSGHTHGGQFFPWSLMIGLFQKYPKGIYRIKNLQLYVNQGTGYWGPSLRLGTYCELTLITLRRAV